MASVATLTCAVGQAGALAPALGPENVIILVNANSPVSQQIVKLYRWLHPAIANNQVLELTGIADSASATSTPAHEIIERDDYETLIAGPVRQYLINQGLVDQIYCIITTAGLPYRIEDTNYPNVIYSGGSDAYEVVANRDSVNAASIESELSVLFQTDPDFDDPAQMPIANRLVNPYQGYISGIRAWENDRDVLGRRSLFHWTVIWQGGLGPMIEGDLDWQGGYSSFNRQMSPADIYLVARLDGPRHNGQTPLFYVKRMLERSARVSNLTYPCFSGYKRFGSVVAIDGAPECPTGCAPQLANAKVYNLRPGVPTATYEAYPVPPGAEVGGLGTLNYNHYDEAYEVLTYNTPPADQCVYQYMPFGLKGFVQWDDTNDMLRQYLLAPGLGLLTLATYGVNAQDGRDAYYVLTGNDDGGPLFTCAPGAIFTSIESFNACTMFTDATRYQGRISDFIAIGGSGAIGHAFEPVQDAIIQPDFLFSNYLRDANYDGVADLTFVEAAYSAMPYLSWAELVVGDPLMRVRLGPGAMVDPASTPLADFNLNGRVDMSDFAVMSRAFGSTLGDAQYDARADLNEDGQIGVDDFAKFNLQFGMSCACDQ